LAALETWRPAAALLRAAYGAGWRTVADRLSSQHRPRDADATLEQQIAGGVNAPPTSSLGRVFDAVAFLLGLCVRNRHEAEAAMALEAAAANEPGEVAPFPFDIAPDETGLRLSLLPTIRDIVAAIDTGQGVSLIAARFHETIAQMLVAAADAACSRHGVTQVGVSGGCFVNRRLLTRMVELLEAQGRQVLYHRSVPPGDGGLALGQALVAFWNGKTSCASVNC
jgi:hydrogenase maturation protein HypF